jgi:hypothetical protein
LGKGRKGNPEAAAELKTNQLYSERSLFYK